MRQIRSSGSVKAIYLPREELLQRLREMARSALEAFPEVREVRLIGSLATGTHTGTSDVDLVIQLDQLSGPPLEQMKPYFRFFSERLNLSLDLFLVGPELPAGVEKNFCHSIVLASRIG